MTAPRLLAALSWAGLIFAAVIIGGTLKNGDAGVFYDVAFPPDYSRSSLLTASYQWSPAFAFWVQPLQLVPWPVFQTGIALASVAALAYLVSAPMALLLVAFQFPLVWTELVEGNVNLIFAVLIVWSVRGAPVWLAPIALTKVLPSVVGLWNVLRGEWRAVGTALVVTVAVALPSLLLAPGSWIEWVGNLSGNVGHAQTETPGLPVIVRVGAALGLVWYAARSERPWLLPIAAALGTHGGIGWLIGLGAWRLLVPQNREVDDGLRHQRVVDHPVALGR